VRGHAPMVQGEKLTITINIGIAGATATTSGIEMLVRSADEALYDAKRAGRERLSLWRPHAAVVQREAAEELLRAGAFSNNALCLVLARLPSKIGI
jgi:predicted signal transduction protein with EAL and GGDEF domain